MLKYYWHGCYLFVFVFSANCFMTVSNLWLSVCHQQFRLIQHVLHQIV